MKKSPFFSIVFGMLALSIFALIMNTLDSEAVTKPSQFYSVVKSIHSGAFIAAGNPSWPTGLGYTFHAIPAVDIEKSVVLTDKSTGQGIEYVAVILTNESYLTAINYAGTEHGIFYQVIEYY